MIFSEVYGVYFRTVAEILACASKEPVTEKKIREIVEREAFAESVLTIPAALKDGRWPFLDKEGRSRLKQKPGMPLTTLEKRWLKALLQDVRISLFEPSCEGLEDVEPLFTPDMFVYFDRYADGDPYGDWQYVEHFRMVRTAIKEGRRLRIRYRMRKGKECRVVCVPCKLEYSAKDDKFRLLGLVGGHGTTINMARILECRFLPECEKGAKLPACEKRKVELLLTDERNALERAMLHFSHFEKVTERLDEKHYHFLLRYDKEDETEVLIRILSFGPRLKVIAPEEFAGEIRARLERQKKLWEAEKAGVAK